MNNKLFIGNLSWGLRSEDLEAAFSEFGTVTDAVVITDRETGRSRGFGFVTFESDDEAAAALDAMNEKEVDGRPMSVSIAKPRD